MSDALSQAKHRLAIGLDREPPFKIPSPELGVGHAAPRFHHAYWRRCSGLAIGGAGAATDASNRKDRLSQSKNHLPIPTTLSVLKSIWEQLGYVEDETVILRSAEGELSRVPGLIAELINRGSGVLVVVGAQAVRAASRTTTTVPIVAIDLETDPIRAGLISSFAHPGGNITGLFLDLPSLAGKWIELLQELLPSVQRIVIGWDGTTGDDQLEVAKAVAVARGLEVVVLETSTFGGFDEAFQRLGDDKRSGIIHLTSPGFSTIAPPLRGCGREISFAQYRILEILCQHWGACDLWAATRDVLLSCSCHDRKDIEG